MKHQASELPSGKPQTRRKTPKIIPIIALTFILTILPLYFPFHQKKILPLSSQIGYQHDLENTITTPTTSSHSPPSPTDPTRRRGRNDSRDTAAANDLPKKEKPKNPSPDASTAANQTALAKKLEQTESKSPGRARTESTTTNQPASNSSDRRSSPEILNVKKCDLFTGEWVPNRDGPYYTNVSCNAIQEHQNCMKFGRPDTEFLKWRWKPDDCDLPIFDPFKFLEMVRGKSLAFVGDSVARNHMQSLICLLSRVAQPVDASSNPTDENRLYQYTNYNFNISIISSPYLIRTEKTDPNDVSRPFRLFLDEYDETWTTQLSTFDYVIISAGHWFFRPTYFYLNRTLTGCLYCPEPNVTHLPSSFSYRRAFRTAFRAINGAKSFKGVVFLRTFAPSHFEGGPWDKGGDCVRRRPFGRNETALEDYSSEMYRIQLEELRTAGRGTGGKLRLFDATRPMMLRPDGHPSKYGRWPVANQTFPNDCVHWCLPGPIDAWSDFLQELLKRDAESYSKS